MPATRHAVLRALLTCITGVTSTVLVASCGPRAPAAAPVLPPDATPATRWVAGRLAAQSACRAHDFATCRARVRELYALTGGAHLLAELAALDARLGDHAAAARDLDAYAAAGLGVPLDAAHDLGGLAANPTIAPVAARLRANLTPVSHATLALPLPREGLVTEGIAWDAPSRTLFVSSVRRRKIIAVDEHGAVRDFVATGADGVGALCGIAVSGDRLWATMSTFPPMLGYDPASAHPTALLAYDVHTGALRQRVDLRLDDARPHALTDLAVGPGGDVFVSDALGGMVYVLAPGASALRSLVARDVFVSPQTPAPSPDGRRLLVPDYLLGIASVNLVTGHTTWLSHLPEVAVDGIDDLHLHGANLLAIQNGTQPVRIVKLTLDAAWTRVETAEVLERESPGLGDPTHGVFRDGELWFLANAGWNRFDDDGSPLRDAPADAPAIMRLAP